MGHPSVEYHTPTDDNPVIHCTSSIDITYTNNICGTGRALSIQSGWMSTLDIPRGIRTMTKSMSKSNWPINSIQCHCCVETHYNSTYWHDIYHSRRWQTSHLIKQLLSQHVWAFRRMTRSAYQLFQIVKYQNPYCLTTVIRGIFIYLRIVFNVWSGYTK